jgi:hypothetical protein
MKLAGISLLQRFALCASAALAVALLVPDDGSAQTDPMIGDWKLNLAKSTYKPGPPPRSSSLNVHQAGDGLMAMFDNVTAQGTPAHPMFDILCNGQPHPVSGAANADSMSCRRPNPYSQEFTNMKGGRVTANGTIVISQDGPTMTIATKGTNANGQPIDNIAVYDRQ